MTETSPTNFQTLTADNKLRKILLEAGNGVSPTPGQLISVLISIKSPTGKSIIEYKDAEEPYHFYLGQNQVIKAIDIGVQSMKIGEKALLLSDPLYAHHSSGSQGTLPEEEQVQIEITLLKAENKEKKPWEFDEEERKTIALALKNDGNELFKSKIFADARDIYSRAIRFIGDDTGDDIDELKFSIYNNLSLMHIKLKEFGKAIEVAEKAIEINFTNVKIWFRKAQAEYGVHNYDQALLDLKEALNLDANNEEVIAEMKRVKEKIKEQNEKDKKVYTSMFK